MGLGKVRGDINQFPIFSDGFRIAARQIENVRYALLILDALEDLKNVTKIKLRFKQGVLLGL